MFVRISEKQISGKQSGWQQFMVYAALFSLALVKPFPLATCQMLSERAGESWRERERERERAGQAFPTAVRLINRIVLLLQS